MYAKILLIDDDVDFLKLLTKRLQSENYFFLIAKNGQSGISLAQTEKPNLIVLDLMLPDMDGINVCRAIKSKEETAQIPVLMLTTREDVDERIRGLTTGADDYISKSCDYRELQARIRILLRRTETLPVPHALARYGKLEINWDYYKIMLGEEEVKLTHTEFSLLQALTRAKKRVLTHEKLYREIWGYEETSHMQTRTLDKHMSNLRKKLKSEGYRIRTIKEVGYCFDDE